MPRVAPRELERTTTGASAAPVDGVRDGDGGHSVSLGQSGVVGEDGVDLRAGLPGVGRGGAAAPSRRRRCGRRAPRRSGRPLAAASPHGVGGRVVGRARAQRRGQRLGQRAGQLRVARARHRRGHAGGVGPQPVEALGQPGRGRTDGGRAARSASATRCARRRRPARAPAPWRRTAWPPGRARAGRRRGRRSPRPGCACAASPTSRRAAAALGRPRRPRSGPSARRRRRPSRPPRRPRPGRRRGRRSAAARCATGRRCRPAPARAASAVRSATPGARRWPPACRPRRRTGPAATATTSASRSRAPVQAGQPAGRLEPEGRRQRLLHQRAAHDDVVPVRGGEPGRRRGRGDQVGVDRGDRVPGQQHRARCRGRPGWSRPRARRRRRRSPTASCSARTSGGTGLPASAAFAHDGREVQPAGSAQAAVTASAAVVGTRPTRAAARASAASISSRARNHASSETAAAAPPRAKVPSKSPLTRASRSRTSSYREEHGLAVTLQVEVEAVAVVGRRRDQRRRAGPRAATAGRRPRRWPRPRRRSRSG